MHLSPPYSLAATVSPRSPPIPLNRQAQGGPRPTADKQGRGDWRPGPSDTGALTACLARDRSPPSRLNPRPLFPNPEQPELPGSPSWLAGKGGRAEPSQRCRRGRGARGPFLSPKFRCGPAGGMRGGAGPGGRAVVEGGKERTLTGGAQAGAGAEVTRPRRGGRRGGQRWRPSRSLGAEGLRPPKRKRK